MGPLTGVRILDFSWAMAGPAATMMLACLGAEVIKVESRTRPDLFRRSDRMAGGGRSKASDQPAPDATFHVLNRAKQSVTLNLRHPAGAGMARQLAGVSDVVVESFRPGVMASLGLDYRTLRAIKQDIIMLSCSFVGSEGPQSKNAGYAPLFIALSGLGEMTGYRDGPPSEIRFSADAVVAFNNAAAILAALLHRQATGEGMFIDLSCVEALSSLIGESLLYYLIAGTAVSRQGNDHENMAPHDCYRCRGEYQWVSIAVANEEEWRALCRAIGDSAWTSDDRFADARSRFQHREELRGYLEDWTRQRMPEEVMTLLQREGVAAVPSYDAPGLLSDPHLAERGIITVVDAPTGRLPLFRPGGKIFPDPEVPVSAAPELGAHNQRVFGELLGLTVSEIAELEQQGVLN